MFYVLNWTKSDNSHDFYLTGQRSRLELEIHKLISEDLLYTTIYYLQVCMKTKMNGSPHDHRQSVLPSCPMFLCITPVHLYLVWCKEDLWRSSSPSLPWLFRLSLGPAPQILSYLKTCNPKSFIKDWDPPFLRGAV